MDALVLVTIASLFFLGHELSVRIWRGEKVPSAPLEQASSSAVVALALWIGSLWILAFAHQLTGPALLVRTLVVLLAAIALRLRREPAWRFDTHLDRRAVLLAGPAFVPVVVWIEFALWRAWIVPPLSHDALSYHLPKAILFARARGYEYLDQLHIVPRKLPINYELLLSDMIITAGNDRITEWLSTLFWALFVIAGMAIVQRWWGPRLLRDTVVALLLSGLPVVLLHSSAHKNDLMTGFFMLCALMWGARFTATGETPAAGLMIVSMAMAVGTKPQAGFVGVALVPFVLWRLWKLGSVRRAALLVLASIVALALLGGASYGIDVWHQSAAGDPVSQSSLVTTIAYGDWSNFWQAPYVLFAAPWSTHAYFLWVPWEKTPWFWRRHEIYFSHLGAAFSMCLLMLPLAIVALRQERSRERNVASLAALFAFIVMLPVVTIPHGMFTISLPRYSLFVVPIVFGWTIEPAMRWVSRRGAAVVLYTASLLFTYYAVDMALNDSFVPVKYVLWARERPGTRVIPFFPNRAPSVADRAAGPREKIAVDAGYSSWIYSAFGADLKRPVQLIPSDKPFRVDPDAQWLVVDRGYDAAWENPEFRDLSQARRFLGRGKISPEGQEIMRKALSEPGFVPFYVDAAAGQAVLRRVR